jgi:uncharacterized repeat protein (TIGR01451 family)
MRKLWSLAQVLALACGLLVVTMLSLRAMQASYAQGLIAMTKVLNKPSNVVRVGELLSFTISLTNNSAFTLTQVTMVDDYDETTLAFAWAIPPQDLHSPASGTITWTNVATPPIPPGQALSFTAYFTAEHPRTTVINYVRAQDIIDSRGAVTVTAETSRTHEAIGGAAPVFKALDPPGFVPATGLPVTFTHVITNDGAAVMTVLPLTDTYDPTFLEFSHAIPTPAIAITGTLVWTDLTTYYGDLQPFQTVLVTTVFTATTAVVSTVNRASTEGAIDVYNNDLAAGSAQVPITIIDSSPTVTPTATATTVPTATPRPTNTPAPARPTSAPTDTPAPTATATPVAALMPQSGQRATGGAFLLLLAALVLGAGATILIRASLGQGPRQR